MSFIERRAERRPEIGSRKKACTVTIVHRDGRSTTKEHRHPVEGIAMAKALKRHRGEARVSRLKTRRARLAAAEAALFRK